jgi:Coatomer epsilon subunit
VRIFHSRRTHIFHGHSISFSKRLEQPHAIAAAFDCKGKALYTKRLVYTQIKIMVEGGTGTAAGAAPDELYTLRAQFALGHYKAALAEANQVARRPMSAALKQEREEYVRRAQMALHQYDLCANSVPGEGPGTFSFCL